MGLGNGRGAPRFCIIASGFVFFKERGKLHTQTQWGPAASGTFVVGGSLGRKREGETLQQGGKCAPTQQPPPENTTRCIDEISSAFFSFDEIISISKNMLRRNLKTIASSYYCALSFPLPVSFLQLQARERRKRCRGRFRCLLFFSGVLADAGEEGEGRSGRRLCILVRFVDLGVV